MGIREEIEKLGAYQHQILNYKYETIVKADVLAILDEHLGKCVTEYQFEAVGLLRLVLRGETKRLIGGLTGDHISVYARRKNESSS